MKRYFFGIVLKPQQKFTYIQEDGLQCYYINNISIVSDSQITVFGATKDIQIKLAHLKDEKMNHKCSLIINEDNIQTIFAIGDQNSEVHLTGYKYTTRKYKPLPYQDEFRALQPPKIENKKIKKIKKHL